MIQTEIPNNHADVTATALPAGYCYQLRWLAFCVHTLWQPTTATTHLSPYNEPSRWRTVRSLCLASVWLYVSSLLVIDRALCLYVFRLFFVSSIFLRLLLWSSSLLLLLLCSTYGPQCCAVTWLPFRSSQIVFIPSLFRTKTFAFHTNREKKKRVRDPTHKHQLQCHSDTHTQRTTMSYRTEQWTIEYSPPNCRHCHRHSFASNTLAHDEKPSHKHGFAHGSLLFSHSDGPHIMMHSWAL